jgi:hypothetical protein
MTLRTAGLLCRRLGVVFAAASGVVYLFACSEAPTEPTPPTAACAFTLEASSTAFAFEGGEGTLTVTTQPGCRWTARADSPWVTVVGSGTGSGAGAAAFRVESNASSERRSCLLRVEGASLSLSQDGRAPCDVSLTPASAVHSADAGEAGVSVTAAAHCEWTATSRTAWLRLVSGEQGSGPGQVRYAIERHAGAESRYGALTIGGRELPVEQRGVSCACSVSQDVGHFGAEGGEGRVDVRIPQGCSWSVAGGAPWIRLEGAIDRRGDDSVRFQVDRNPTAEPRSAVMALGQCAHRVNQAGMASSACEYHVVPAEHVLHWHHHGGTIEVTTQAGCGWTVAIDASWISIAPPASRSGAGTVSFTVMAPFTEDATRSAPVMVRWPAATEGQNVWVRHEGCRYGVNPQAAMFLPSGGTGRVDVVEQAISWSCPIPCAWTAEPDVPWIRIRSGSPNSGSNPFTFEVEPSNQVTDRFGFIRVGNARVIVQQRGGGE